MTKGERHGPRNNKKNKLYVDVFIEDETFTLNTTYSVLSAVQNPCLSSDDNCLTTAMTINERVGLWELC